jgi:hypothetical protein
LVIWTEWEKSRSEFRGQAQNFKRELEFDSEFDWRTSLLDLFVDRVGVAVGTELLEFQTGSGVTTVFHRGIAGDTSRTLVQVSAALHAFQGDDDPYAFTLSHDSFLA